MTTVPETARVLPIRIYGDPVLTRRAEPVESITPEIETLAADMAASMYDAYGRGLAAPQVGVLKRLFVMDTDWKITGTRDPLVVIDPFLSDPSDEMSTVEEGCLSIPDVPLAVIRPAAITMRWTGLDGARREKRLTGAAATIAQHEYDHLDGILIPDRAAPDLVASVAGRLAALAETGGALS